MVAKAKAKAKATKADTKEVAELRRAVKAMHAIHNPIAWAAIVKFLAPFVARIAARYAAKYVANRLGRKLKVSLSKDAADATADKIIEMLEKLKD